MRELWSIIMSNQTYPVRISIGNSGYEYAMVTLEQANQRFTVVDGCLVSQEVYPMTEEYVLSRLKYETESLAEAKNDLVTFTELSTAMREKIEGEIVKRTKDVAILTQAKQHYEAKQNV
jgi:hypothetical protein